ncbi:hypothetical protein [Undibacterium terreum]|nr:hypothetical protein [Undibacterium terreum]
MKTSLCVLSLFLSALLMAVMPLQAAAQDTESRLREAIRDGNPTILKVQGATIRVVFAEGKTVLSKEQILDWVRTDAQTVAKYYGAFPVPELGLLLVPVAGGKINQGVTYGDGMPVIRVGIGRDADAATLERDWVMVHEMVHLAFPLMPRRHHWLEEGIATYVEPLARAQAGLLPPEKVWGDLMRDLHQGLPADGDQGLDNTHTWGRTYWGGALFCLMAELRLREQTNNRFGLQDALRGINRDSGGMAHEWPILRALKAGDAATGMQVLSDLYAEMANKPVTPDLPVLWARLGVAMVDGKIVFNDRAAMAGIRQAITRAR